MVRKRMTKRFATTAAVIAAALASAHLHVNASPFGGGGGSIWFGNSNSSSVSTASTVRPLITTIFDEEVAPTISIPYCSKLNNNSEYLEYISRSVSTSTSGSVSSDDGGVDVITIRESSTRRSVVDDVANNVDEDDDNPSGSIIADLNESELFYGTGMEVIMMSEGDLVRQRRSSKSSGGNELTIEDVKYFTYGILWPTICGLGIIGNILNLIVLNQPNMKGTAYIYMRGYSSAALMAITVAIPFANRVLQNNEVGPWTNIYIAFFHTYVELYLGNSCLGIGVMMLVALTMERFVAVCHPEKSRALQGSKKAYIIIASIPLCTFLTYSPHLFLSTLSQCVTEQGIIVYQKRPNFRFLASVSYWIYKWFLGLVFRLIPTVLLAYLNLRIIIAYRRTCARRRIMTGKASRDESKKFAEESRIMLLLGSTSVLFFVCVTPMVILSVMISDKLLKSFSFQVFRATANLLEVTNYSLTFYIYCLFSREFRNTFLGLLRIGQTKGPLVAGVNGATPTNKPSGGNTGTNGKVSSDPAAGGGATPTPTPPQQQGGSTPLL